MSENCTRSANAPSQDETNEFPAFGSGPASSLAEPALPPNLVPTLLRWIDAVPKPFQGTLIGGLAMCFYRRPRMTMGIDILVPSEYALPDKISGFSRIAACVFVDNANQIEINACTPSTIGISDGLSRRVLGSARIIDGVSIASVEGLIALKLHAAHVDRRKLQESADIQSLLEYREVDLSEWDLSLAHCNILAEIAETAQSWIGDPSHPRFARGG